MIGCVYMPMTVGVLSVAVLMLLYMAALNYSGWIQYIILVHLVSKK